MDTSLPFGSVSLPTAILVISTVLFLALERLFPGRTLPHARGWHVRAILYWWHRLRHAKGWWLVFHPIHHSPARIELLTSFYKQPAEILADAILSALILYPWVLR